TTLTVSGTDEAGATDTTNYLDVSPVLVRAVATGGSFTITTSALADGSHTLTAKATDAAGNVSAASAGFTVIEDTAAPNAPAITTVHDNVDPVQGDLASGDSTNNTKLHASGTAE